MFRLESHYASLPEPFYERVNPTRVVNPKLLLFNDALLQQLQIEREQVDSDTLPQYLAGNLLFPGSTPIAMAYSGHQFGHFNPHLGDGRAILLGELNSRSGILYDLHLKGSGRTKFSRRGDGRAALGPMLREWILSEAMNALLIPTTRSLAVLSTGESVQRQTEEPGGILARVAKSHVRVGTFEYFAARGDLDAIQVLTDHCIDRLYPDLKSLSNAHERKTALFLHVVERQAKLIAQWMQVGFVHGVMNTDNMSIAGETIDYGPCAFLDEYHASAVWSSIDEQGRYAYGNQPFIASWNLDSLRACLQVTEPNPFLKKFEEHFKLGWIKKIGLTTLDDFKWAESLLKLMQDHQLDFTNTLRNLSVLNLPELTEWKVGWVARLKELNKTPESLENELKMVNPAIIPRNHLVDEAIRAATDLQDFNPLIELTKRLRDPFVTPEAKFTSPPKPHERITETFCGT